MEGGTVYPLLICTLNTGRPVVYLETENLRKVSPRRLAQPLVLGPRLSPARSTQLVLELAPIPHVQRLELERSLPGANVPGDAASDICLEQPLCDERAPLWSGALRGRNGSVDGEEAGRDVRCQRGPPHRSLNDVVRGQIALTARIARREGHDMVLHTVAHLQKGGRKDGRRVREVRDLDSRQMVRGPGGDELGATVPVLPGRQV